MSNKSVKRAVPMAGLGAVALLLAIGGCGPSDSSSPETTEENDPPVLLAPEDTAGSSVSIAELKRQLRANENAQFQKAGGRIRQASLFNAGVEDISPLKGLPLKFLDLTGNPIRDLSPLAGMPLEELYLEGTRVRDLRPLDGMPLRVLRMEHSPVNDITPLESMPIQRLNLFDTAVEDIEVIATLPLKTLWIPQTSIDDISVLEGMRLESLDVQDTPVSDLDVLEGMQTLVRLNIAGSQVTDLTPLTGLSLQRLIFTPERIEVGMDVVRNMPSLTEIGTDFETRMRPEDFWNQLDAASAAKSESTL